jgi:methylthioribose-1-phosphate isomerase
MVSFGQLSDNPAIPARSVDWQDDALVLIDQTLLPEQVRLLHLKAYRPVVDAIKRLSVRGAPSIGVAGAFGVAIAFRELQGDTDGFSRAVNELRLARPTAVNLARAVDRVAANASGGFDVMLKEALAIRIRLVDRIGGEPSPAAHDHM